jgi:dihydrofolate reductase
MINIIVATSKNRVIGNNNSLIWKLPADLKRFKQITTGSTVVMGRKTYESIGKPLPNRRNIIITRDTNYLVDNCEVVNSLEEALMLCNNECFIIGGGEIYKQSIDIADKIYLTLVQEDFEGDTYFPEIGKEWTKVFREDFEGDEKNEHKYSFIDYERYKF